MSVTSSATTGFFQPQASGPFSAASINGNYFGGTPPPTVRSMLSTTVGIPVVNDAELTSSGGGFVGITFDLSLNGGAGHSLLQGQQGGLSLTVAANGRATDGESDIYYVIGPSSFLMLIPDAAGSSPVPATPVIDVFQQ